MPACVACGQWHPRSAQRCARCGGPLGPAPPPTVSRRPPSTLTDEGLRAALIAEWWEDRARSGIGGETAAAVAARLRAGDPACGPLWRAWGRRDAWWPNWEAEEELNELLRAGTDVDEAIRQAVRWTQLTTQLEPADQVGRWLKVQARAMEHDARRSADSSVLTARASLVRRAAAAAREPRHADTCERILGAQHTDAGGFSPAAHLYEVVRQVDPSTEPDELLARLLADAAVSRPRHETLDRLATGAALALVAVIMPPTEAVTRLINRIRGKAQD
jgi:hypothetical protein